MLTYIKSLGIDDENKLKYLIDETEQRVRQLKNSFFIGNGIIAVILAPT